VKASSLWEYSLGTRSSQSTTKSVPPKGRPQFSCMTAVESGVPLALLTGNEAFLFAKAKQQIKTHFRHGV
jgi:hypothetical protein